MAQFVHQENDTNFGGALTNIGATTYYLWLSAWLYATTGNKVYFDGLPDNSGTLQGGMFNEAQWLITTSGLVQAYPTATPQPPLDPKGTLFLFDGSLKTDSGCSVDTNDTSAPKETQHMGTALAGLSAIYQALTKAATETGGNIPVDYPKAQSQAYYLDVADNLAETIIGGTASGPLVTNGGPQFIDGAPGVGVLSETCDSQYSDWPDGCDVTGGVHVWLPGKGIFVSAVHCLDSDLTQAGAPDSGLQPFIAGNASSLWTYDQNPVASTADVNEFGFLWDNNLFQTEQPTANTQWPSGGQPGQGYATQASALEALSARLNGSSAMCN